MLFLKLKIHEFVVLGGFGPKLSRKVLVWAKLEKPMKTTVTI